jgi:hypothetical protein
MGFQEIQPQSVVFQHEDVFIIRYVARVSQKGNNRGTLEKSDSEKVVPANE